MKPWDRDSAQYQMAANVKVGIDDPVIIVGGLVRPVDGVAATGVVVGFSTGNVDNTGGAAGALTVVIDFRRPIACTKLKLATTGAPTSANIWSQVSINASKQVIAGVTGNAIGRLIDLIPDEGVALVAVGDRI